MPSESIVPGSSYSIIKELENDLRREWWLNHGCAFAFLYGDDGEMQCGRCMIDFKCKDFEALRADVLFFRSWNAYRAMIDSAASDLVRPTPLGTHSEAGGSKEHVSGGVRAEDSTPPAPARLTSFKKGEADGSMGMAGNGRGIDG